MRYLGNKNTKKPRYHARISDNSIYEISVINEISFELIPTSSYLFKLTDAFYKVKTVLSFLRIIAEQAIFAPFRTIGFPNF